MGDLLQSIASLDAWAYWAIVLVLGGLTFLVLWVGFLLTSASAKQSGEA